MAAGYKITNANWPAGADLDDIYVPASYFQEGGLWTWGDNGVGELGDNTTTNKSSPVQTICFGTNWKQVSAGGYHTAAIKTDGTLWTWGQNNNGQLGDNTNSLRSSPVQTVAGGTNWKQLSAGYYINSAIKTDGTLWLWGNNSNGILGDNTITARSSPVQTVAGGTNWKQTSSNQTHTTAIKTDGTLWTWGFNYSGRLGDNTITNRSSPVQTVAGGTNWKQVVAGGSFTLAIKTDGSLWTWGNNSFGQLGDNTTTHKSSPVQTVAGGNNWKTISAGQFHSGAIKTDGTLWTWGYNAYGQVGDNTITSRSSPVQTICSGSNWKSVTAGGTHTTAIKTDGTLWLWGRNTNGNLGDGTTTSKSSPVQTVAGGTNWKQIGINVYQTAAVKYDG